MENAPRILRIVRRSSIHLTSIPNCRLFAAGKAAEIARRPLIVAESSALIEYYRLDGDIEVRRQIAAAIAADQVAINGIIQVKINAYAAGKRKF